MKKTIKSILMMTTIAFLVACSSNKNGWKLLNYSAVDQKSYAIAYSTTAQTYQDRVNESYDINAFMNGVNDWYTKKSPYRLNKFAQ